MAKRVVWTYPAREDLRSHLQYLVEKSPGAAQRLFEEAEAAGDSLDELPERGRVVPELGEPHRREILVGKYRLVYRVTRDDVIILRMIHGRRDFLSAWKKKPK